MKTPITDDFELSCFEQPGGTNETYNKLIGLCRTLEREREEYKNTVARIWAALGNPPYVSLDGKTIWDVVAELQGSKKTHDAALMCIQQKDYALTKAKDEMDRLFAALPITGQLPSPSVMQHITYAISVTVAGENDKLSLKSKVIP